MNTQKIIDWKRQIEKLKPVQIRVLKEKLFNEFAKDLKEKRYMYEQMVKNSEFLALSKYEQNANELLFLKKNLNKTIEFCNTYHELGSYEVKGGRKKSFGLSDIVQYLFNQHYKKFKTAPSAKDLEKAYPDLAKNINILFLQNSETKHLQIAKTLTYRTISPYLKKLKDTLSNN